MAHHESRMTTKEDLVEGIQNILKTDLDFLLNLAPSELVILATSLKGLVEREKNRSLRN